MKTQDKWIAAALVLLSSLLITFIASRIPIQWDVTSEGFYSLSKGSKNLLKSIEEPIQIDYYFSRSAEGLPSFYKNFGERVAVFLRQYERSAKGMIQLRIIDPKPDTKEEEAAIRAGVLKSPLPNGASFFLGLVATQADQEESIETVSFQRESFLEYDISQLISKVQQVDRPSLGIITPLAISEPEPQRNPMMRGQPMTRDWAFLAQLRERFEVRIIPTTSESIEPAVDLLMVIHPQNLPERLQYAIDQHVTGGKPLILALDPSSVTQKQTQNPQAVMMGLTPTSSNLTTLLDQWGISFDDKNIVGDLEFAARVSSGMGQAVLHPIWMQNRNLNRELPVVAPLGEVLLVEPGSFSFAEKDGLTFASLIETSAQSAALPLETLRFAQPQEILKNIRNQLAASEGRPLVLAGMLSGKFTSAFPEGRPAAPKTEDDKDATPPPEENPENQSPHKQEGESVVIVLGDTDFLNDGYSVERLNFFGSEMLRPINDNLSLILNLAEFATGNQDLLSLRGRGSTTRPFTRVQEIELQAQSRYQDSLDTINQQLQDVQKQLRELQTQQNRDGLLVATPEVQQAIREFQEQEASAIASRREIRKKLREDIEALDRNLVFFNMALVPFVITVLGIRFFVRRNRSPR
ncbi:MAG: Gldg family protein [Opitutales bacterium]|nr:Gldg family protein [Opitutales bacterium]